MLANNILKKSCYEYYRLSNERDARLEVEKKRADEAVTYAQKVESTYKKKLKDARTEYLEIAGEMKKRNLERLDLMEQEVAIKDEMIQKLNVKSNKILDELAWCEKIIKSVRRHYKDLENADFENLKQ